MEGELFSHSQTFLGVLLTLVVLCLFNNESNFLLELLTTFNNDMENYLKNCLDSLKKTFLRNSNFSIMELMTRDIGKQNLMMLSGRNY